MQHETKCSYETGSKGKNAKKKMDKKQKTYYFYFQQ